jgi:hypothetical protein
VQAGTQTPLGQRVVPWALVQVTSHVPHVATLLRLDSQPLPAVASQSPKPSSHVGEHKPLAHATLPCGLMQESEQLPQVADASEVLASQPFVASPSQSA